MAVNSVVLLIICIFTFIPLLLAEFARNRSVPTLSDFFLQGRRMGMFPMYATVFATWMSAFAFMGAIAYFYEQGPIYMTTVGWDALFAVLFYAVGRRIWFYGKTNGYVTPTDFFHDIYQSSVLDLLVTAVTFIFTMIYIQIQMIGGLFLIQIATKGYISWQVSGLIFFAILVIYLWAGGLRAVALTDTFYGILIIITIISSGIFLMKTVGTMEEMFQRIIDQDITNVTLGGPQGPERVGLWLCLFVIVPVGAFMGPQMWIRNYAAKEVRNFELLPFLLCLSSIVCVGTLLSGSAGILLNRGEIESDTLIVHLMLKYAHPLFCAFVFLGIAAAIFSTANSQIHALSAIYTIDIHKRYINKRITENKLLSIAKWTVLAVSAISYVLLLVIPQSIFDMAIIALGGTAQMIVPVLGALFWRQSTGRGALAGLLSGIGVFFLLIAFSGLEGSFCAVLGLLANGIVFLLFAFLQTERGQTGEKIETYKAQFKAKCK